MSKQTNLTRNTHAEEAEIQRGIADDPDTFEPTDEKFAQVKRRVAAPSTQCSVTSDMDSPQAGATLA
jgi:hypothetical protein